MKKMFLYLFVFSFFSSCNRYDCYWNHYLNVTGYEVSSDAKTPILGIPVTTNGNDVDLQKIDELILYVENCLGFQVKRNCLEVVIPPDWYVSYCQNPNGEELFPCRIDPQVCANKGFPIDPDCVMGQSPDKDCPYPECLPSEVPDGHCPCPCNCRAVIQDENVIITTPNLKLFSAELIRMMTGVNNIWEEEWTRKCYKAPEEL